MFSKKIKKKIFDFHQQNLSIQDIAACLNMNRLTINNILKNKSLKIRKKMSRPLAVRDKEARRIKRFLNKNFNVILFLLMKKNSH